MCWGGDSVGKKKKMNTAVKSSYRTEHCDKIVTLQRGMEHCDELITLQ